MAATTGTLMRGDAVSRSSMDTAMDAAVLPPAWPTHSKHTVALAPTTEELHQPPPIVLVIPDLEALEARSVEVKPWRMSPVVLKGVGMVGSVIVTIIVAAILASFKTHPPQPIVSEAPTWQLPATTEQTPLRTYNPPADAPYAATEASDGNGVEQYDGAGAQASGARDFQAAPEMSADHDSAPIGGGPAFPVGNSDSARASGGALPQWPSFNPPPRDENVSNSAGPRINGFVTEPTERTETAQPVDPRPEMRTADSRAGLGDAARRDGVEVAPVARLNGNIIKSNSDRSYGNSGSSLH